MDLLNPRPQHSPPLTPINFLERAATVYPSSLSMIHDATTFTWEQTHRRCLQLASSHSSLGIKRGDVVSVIAPNIPAMYELHFAVPMCGAILNTINTRLDARMVSLLLLHSDSKLIFVDQQSLDLVLQALSLLPPQTPLPRLVPIVDPTLPAPLIRTRTRTRDLDYEDLIRNGDDGYKWIRPESEWSPMVLNYTSGTTSSPKGVVHSHRGIFITSLNNLLYWDVPKQPTYLWTLPMFHANGWGYPWSMAAVGGTNVCLRKFDSAKVYEKIRKHDVTHMCGAPVVLNMLANAPNAKPLRRPVQILTAGAPPPAEVLFRTENLGFVVSHGYGLTETAGLSVTCEWNRKWNGFSASERARLKARQGVGTLGMTEMDVVDPETGLSVKRDGLALGEVVLRGGCVMLGYLKDPVGTDNCMKKNGWFYTGDVGVMHPDGYLEIKDRAKDVIISGGENLSSVEVESVLYSHPAVHEAAVVARPDEFWGETPCAFVCLKPNSTETGEKEIIEFCRAKLPHYMVPKTVVFSAELPKTSTGKTLKFVLREKAKAMGSSRVRRLQGI